MAIGLKGLLLPATTVPERGDFDKVDAGVALVVVFPDVSIELDVVAVVVSFEEDGAGVDTTGGGESLADSVGFASLVAVASTAVRSSVDCGGGVGVGECDIAAAFGEW